jgi:transposase-like protein
MARNQEIRMTFTPQFARSLLQRWKDQLDRKQPPEVLRGSDNGTSGARELAELRKKQRRVTEERDIWKKALAFFAEDES